MPTEITDKQIAELRRLHEASTPPERFSVMRYGHGGGRVCSGSQDLVADFYSEADRECWISARNALPALLARIERAEKERDEARNGETAAVADWGGAVSAGQREEELLALIATLEKERDEARTELRAFIGNVEEMTLGEGVPAGLVVMDPGSDRPRAVSSHVTTQWYEAIMDKWHRDKDDLIAMYERGQREAMHAPMLRARIATLEEALRCDGTTSGKHEWRAGEYEDAREKNWCCRCARNATDIVDAALRGEGEK